jgi:hypothetical protein
MPVTLVFTPPSGSDPSELLIFTLDVIGEDDRDASEVPKSFDVSLATLGSSTSIRVVDPSGSLLLEGTSPAASPRTFTLPVNDEDGDYGDVVPKRLHLTLTQSGGLPALIIDDGHGSMQLAKDWDNKSEGGAVRIVDGGTHTLECTRQVAMQRHLRWVRADAVERVCKERDREQSGERAAKLAFMASAHAACQQVVGELRLHSRVVLGSRDGQAREIHGLLLSAAAVIVVEAAHPAEQSHVQAALDKVAFVAGLDEGEESLGAFLLQGVTSAVPVLASSSFPAAVAALCRARGVGVVQPMPCGGGYTYTPPALARHLPVRRALHTLARVLRAAL